VPGFPLPVPVLLVLLLSLLAPLLGVGPATAAPARMHPAGSLPTAPVSTTPVSTAPASTTRPDPCAGASEEQPVLVEVTTLLPRAPQRPDEPFQVAGRLRNCGDRSLNDLEVRLAVGGRLASRSALQQAADEPVLGRRRLAAPAQADELTPGASTGFDLRLPVSELRLGRLGVYPLAVQARARYGEDRSRTAVGLVTTFVPWFPEGPPAPTRIAWLWPLVDVPRRGPAEVMLDDELEELVSGGTGSRPAGRLHQLLSTAAAGAAGGCEPAAARAESTSPGAAPPTECRGEPVPITYGVDPSLLHSVESMTRPHAVLSDGAPVQQPASAAAAAWLESLREAARDDDVLALPFGDPDIVAMSRADPGLRAQVEPLRRLGESEVARVLGVEPLPSVAWPPPGPLPAALDVLVSGQTRALVLDSSALLPASQSRSRTPSARVELPSVTGPVGGLVVEPVLSALLESPDGGAVGVALPGEEPSPGGGGRLAEQRWIAETAMIAAETPSASRTLLVAPSRLAAVDPDVAAAVLADTGRLPWLCPVPLADVAAGRERCAELPDEQGPAAAQPSDQPDPTASPPPAAQSAGLSPAFLDRLADVTLAADQFTEAILVPGSESAAATRARLLRATGRAASAAWRDQPLQGREMLRLLEDDVAALRAKVRLVSGPITLTGSSGTLPLLVQNELDQPVTVGVVLDETSAARLSLSTSGAQVVPARELYERISVQVEPRTSGRFVVLATLVDAQGRRFGDPVALPVRSTGYGGVALAVTWAAAGVLMVAAGTRIVRRDAPPPAGRVTDCGTGCRTGG
jgi:hypothetical protein